MVQINRSQERSHYPKQCNSHLYILVILTTLIIAGVALFIYHKNNKCNRQNNKLEAVLNKIIEK
ncbi:hypothetical protein P0136_11945 [Lentisphaerota bacterium ZTH]|nr:hypothetical protein JYG24_10545 [Lentisphaerota bacterium]WET06069.1 hypothetical protein P0136_11945 [Lentisphaerota bacterium ZTH]